MGTNTNAPSARSASARNVLDSIRRIVRWLRVASRATEKQVGLSSAQLFVLQRLSAGPVSSLNELAERTLTHQSSASVVVAKLVSRGLVQRIQSRHDARRLEISLTPAARKLLRRAPNAPAQRLVKALNAMNQRDVTQLARLMEKFVKASGLGGQVAPMLFEDPERPRRRTHVPTPKDR